MKFFIFLFAINIFAILFAISNKRYEAIPFNVLSLLMSFVYIKRRA